MIVVLSLGAGVQSTTLALMGALGAATPMPDCAIFADTGEEPRATYDHLVWLTGCALVEWIDENGRPRVHAKAGTWKTGVLPFPTHIAQAWTGHGKPSIHAPLGDEILAAAAGAGKAGSHSRPPFYVRNLDGTGGIIRRQCTGDYKIDVIQGRERDLLGLKKASCASPRPSRSRSTAESGSLSAIAGAEWRRTRDTDPAGWARSIQIDRAIRKGLVEKALVGELYLHDSRQPLEDVDLSEKPKKPRPQLNLFENECEGVCGV